MRVTVSDEYTRVLFVDGVDIPNGNNRLKVGITYLDTPDCYRGVALDSLVIPLFKAAPDLLDALQSAWVFLADLEMEETGDGHEVGMLIERIKEALASVPKSLRRIF